MRPYDYGFVGEMSVLMNAHPLIGPALAELFMQVMFAPARLRGPSARWSRRWPPRPRIATTERSPTQSFCVPGAGTANLSQRSRSGDGASWGALGRASGRCARSPKS